MLFPEPLATTPQAERRREAPFFICRCPECQCSSRTQHQSKVCWTCRDVKGVGPRYSHENALLTAAHHSKARTRYPVDRPVGRNDDRE